MSRTVVGVVDEITEAEQVVEELVDGGFSRNEISIVAHRAKCGPSLGPVESITGGGGPGAPPVVGGLTGLAAGMVALAVPGIGPVLAAGPIAAELVAGGVGTVTGTVLGRLKGRGVPDEDAGCYCEALRRGGILVSVETSDERVADAERIIGQHRLVDLDDCAAEWRDHGWKGFDPDARPWPADKPIVALPFDKESLRPSVQRERRARRTVRSYFRVS